MWYKMSVGVLLGALACVALAKPSVSKCALAFDHIQLTFVENNQPADAIVVAYQNHAVKLQKIGEKLALAGFEIESQSLNINPSMFDVEHFDGQMMFSIKFCQNYSAIAEVIKSVRANGYFITRNQI